jgi:phosphate-selective porin OprO/OprP
MLWLATLLSSIVAFDSPAPGPAFPAVEGRSTLPRADSVSPAPTARLPPSLGGLLQVQFLTVVRENQPSPSASGTSLRRARISIDGNVYVPQLGYRAELELGQDGLGPLDLYMEYRPSPRWSLRLGQLRVPFSRNWLIAEARLAFAERSAATEEFRYGHDVGVLASVALLAERVSVSLGAFNGAGRNAVNDNVDPVLVARVDGTVGSPWNGEEGDLARTRPPSVTGGLAATLDYAVVPAAYGFASGAPLAPTVIVNHDTDGDGRPDGVRVLQLEADLALRWRGFAVDGEVYYRREAWADVGSAQPPASQFVPNQAFGGFFADATGFILPGRLQAGARLSLTDVSPLTIGGRRRPATTCVAPLEASPSCSLPYTSRLAELTAVLVGHGFGHGVQVVAMYSLLRWRTTHDDVLPWTREQHFLLQAQLAF